MYHIELNTNKKIIYVHLSGSLTTDEIITYLNDFKNLANQHETNEFSILILANTLDPLPQDSLGIYISIIKIMLSWAKKIAYVNGNRFITNMQLSRVETEARNSINSDTHILRFKTKNEAFVYINR